MHAYLTDLIQNFEQQADAVNAASMKKYMKGRFDFYGIPSPQRKELSKNHFRAIGYPAAEAFEDVVHACWNHPKREMQYVAMDLASRVAKKGELCRIDLYEFMILEKSWWDTVDFIASNLVGVHFLRFPDAIEPYTSGWMESGNRWLQRTAVLYQLKYKQKTDLDLLTGFIDQLQGSKEFFINKAIGWMLREYSKTDAQWVLDYVSKHAGILAPLSTREALKWLKNKNLLPDEYKNLP